MATTFLYLPPSTGAGSNYWQDPVADASALPATGNYTGEVIHVLSDHSLRYWDGAAWQIMTAGPAGTYVLAPASSTDNGIVRFDGTTGKIVQNSSNVVIDDTGQVGIGTTSPTTKLDVRGGSIRLDNAQALFFRNAADSANINAISVDGADRTAIQSGGSTFIYAGTGSPVILNSSGSTTTLQVGAVIDFNVGSYSTRQDGTKFGPLTDDVLALGSTSMRWSAISVGTSDSSFGGKVGVGTTGPGAMLQIVPSGSSTIGSIIKGAASQSANLTEWQNSSGTALSAVDAAGKLGVGVAAPSYPLDVRSTSVTQVNIQNTTTGAAAYTSLYMHGADTSAVGYVGLGGATVSNTGMRDSAFFGTANAYSAKIFTNDTVRMTVDSTGNVGIGASPASSAALEISSTTGALLLPRMTSTQRDALTAVNGMLIYNSSTNKVQARENGAWNDVTGWGS